MDDSRFATGKLQPRDMPSPPAVLAKVIRMANDPKVSMDQLSQVVASDPAFAAELIRMANSPFYSVQSAVKTTARALVLLGGRTVRCLAICFAARDILSGSGFEPEDLTNFWEDSLRRGAAARRLARMSQKADPEEAFTVGLLLEFGIIAILREHPGHLPEWRAMRKEAPEVRRQQEGEVFGVTHDRVVRDLTAQWGLPAGLVAAVAHHHHPESEGLAPTHRDLTTIAHLSDIIASVYSSTNAREALAQAREGLAQDLKFAPEAIDELLHAVSGDVTEAAAAFGVRVRKQPTHLEILEDANRALTALNLSYEELTSRLERTIKEKDEIAAELQRVNQRLQELVYFDPLTGLANRRRFEETFLAEIARIQGVHAPLSLLMLDLDHFKMVNDVHGHVVGDLALKAVAGVVQKGTRASDVASRFGGEEMAVLMPGASEEDARRISERLRQAVAALKVIGPKRRVALTVSIGGTTVRGGAFLSSADMPRRMRRILEAADRALYASKRGGRNRVSWSSDASGESSETF